MRKIECFLQPSRFDKVKDELRRIGIPGMSISEVQGFGTQRGCLEGETINNQVELLPKIKVEIILEEDEVDETIRQIRKSCYSRAIGSGKLFVIPVEDAVRIRTSETGHIAIQ